MPSNFVIVLRIRLILKLNIQLRLVLSGILINFVEQGSAMKSEILYSLVVLYGLISYSRVKAGRNKTFPFKNDTMLN